MGGGDLNSKKSWHPNTMKNQERVWKAEQAAAQENKRIVELQRERDVERDRTELNNMVKKNSETVDDNRLHWMYDKPDKKVQDEDFLLGKSIDKGTEQSSKSETDPIPAVGRRVVGSSMLTSGGDSQVDIARKIREDPLLLIKERERAARAALLNNPLQRKKLTELLQKEQAERKKNMKKHKKKDKDLDNMLAAKLNALGGHKTIDLATLLNSDDSSSDSSTKEKLKKKRKKEKLKNKTKIAAKKKRKNSSDESDESKTERPKKDYNKITKTEGHSSPIQENRKRKSDKSYQASDENYRAKRDKTQDMRHDRESKPDGHKTYDSSYRSHSSRKKSPIQSKYRSEQRRCGLTDEERALRLAAMASAGVEREEERSRRVADQRAADEDAAKRPTRRLIHNEARSLPDSVESRIHSNRHYIQRNSQHMSEHFARR